MMVVEQVSQMPKHQQIESYICRQIADGVWRDGAAIPSVRELGQIHGTSPLTARKAVAALIDRGVLEGRRGVGTFVIPRPVLTRVGVLLNVGTGEDSPKQRKQGRWLHLVEDRCRQWARQQHADIVLYEFDGDVEHLRQTQFWRDLEDDRFDGVLLASVHDVKVAQAIISHGMPMVALGDNVASPYRIMFDYRGMVADGIRALARRNIRSLAVVLGVTGAEFGGAQQEHEAILDAAYRCALESGIQIDRSGIVRVSPINAENAKAKTLEMLDAGRCPDGWLITDNIAAIGTLDALAERGKVVGRDVHVATHANLGQQTFSQEDQLVRMETDPGAVVTLGCEILAGIRRGEVPARCTNMCQTKLIDPMDGRRRQD